MICGVYEEGGFVEIKSVCCRMVLALRGPPGGSRHLQCGGPSEEGPLGPRCILTLRGFAVWGVWGAEAVEVKVPSPSLRFSHRRNANCKLDVQLSSSGL